MPGPLSLTARVRSRLPRGLHEWAVPILVAAASLASLFNLVRRHETADWDTDQLVHQGLAGTYEFSWTGAGDTAHPFGYVPIRLFLRAFGENADTAWHLLLGAVLVLIIVSLMTLAWLRGAGPGGFLAAAALLGISLVFRDLASRSEENLIGDLFFVVTVGLILVYVSQAAARPWLLAAVAAASLVTALNHLQFFMVIAVGVALACLLSRRRGPRHMPLSRAAALLSTVVVLPGAAILLLFEIGVAKSFSYGRYYQCVCNPDTFDGLPSWSVDFLKYASKWLVGLDAPGPAAPGGAGRVLLGLVALGVAALVVLRARDLLVATLSLAALGLPFLYEPHSPERWDAFVVMLAVALVWGPVRDRTSADAAPGTPSTR